MFRPSCFFHAPPLLIDYQNFDWDAHLWQNRATALLSFYNKQNRQTSKLFCPGFRECISETIPPPLKKSTSSSPQKQYFLSLLTFGPMAALTALLWCDRTGMCESTDCYSQQQRSLLKVDKAHAGGWGWGGCYTLATSLDSLFACWVSCKSFRLWSQNIEVD